MFAGDSQPIQPVDYRYFQPSTDPIYITPHTVPVPVDTLFTQQPPSFSVHPVPPTLPSASPQPSNTVAVGNDVFLPSQGANLNTGSPQWQVVVDSNGNYQIVAANQNPSMAALQSWLTRDSLGFGWLNWEYSVAAIAGWYLLSGRRRK